MMFRFLFSLCVLCALCGESSLLPLRSSGRFSPAARSAGPRPCSPSPAQRLADAQEVLVYYPGIAVTKLEVVNDTTLKVTVTIAAGLPARRARVPRPHRDRHLRAAHVSGSARCRSSRRRSRTASSTSRSRSRSTSPSTASSQNEDVDYFVVECKKGQRLSVEVEGMRLGVTFFDPYVAILDAKRFELATGDDSPLAGQDGGCSVVIPADGKYIVQVRESAYGGNGACQYRLHVGTFPRPTGRRPRRRQARRGTRGHVPRRPGRADQAEGEAARPTTATAIGGSTARRPTASARPDSSSASAICRTWSNRERTTRRRLRRPEAAPGAFNGVIAKPGEVDYFKFTAKKGQVFDVHCYARQLGSPLDPVMYVGVLGGRCARRATTTAVGPDSYFRFTAPEDKEYALWVHDHLQKGGPDYFYRIEVTPVQPRIETTIPRVDGNNPAEPGSADDHRAEGQALRGAARRQPRRLRRSAYDGPGQTAAGRDARGRPDGPGPQRRARRVRGEAGRRDWRVPDRHHGNSCRPEGAGAGKDRVRRGVQRRDQQHAVHAALLRPHRRRGGRSGPVLDRSDRAEGAAGAERLVQPEDRGEARRRLQGGDHRLPALDAAGNGHSGLRGHSRRGRRSACCR